ncbi:MAG: hypothetical protein GWP18_05945 [Proteobacteria bacterium]|nr:hypothetical protein [Pseudomonadota bacterium]
MGTIASLLVIFVIISVVWWLFKKVLHIGFIFAIGIALLIGWWYFFVQ